MSYWCLLMFYWCFICGFMSFTMFCGILCVVYGSFTVLCGIWVMQMIFVVAWCFYGISMVRMSFVVIRYAFVIKYWDVIGCSRTGICVGNWFLHVWE